IARRIASIAPAKRPIGITTVGGYADGGEHLAIMENTLFAVSSCMNSKGTGVDLQAGVNR
ncbi:hypothetical protein KI387_040747, partial [Taxus chinensis]